MLSPYINMVSSSGRRNVVLILRFYEFNTALNPMQLTVLKPLIYGFVYFTSNSIVSSAVEDAGTGFWTGV